MPLRRGRSRRSQSGPRLRENNRGLEHSGGLEEASGGGDLADGARRRRQRSRQDLGRPASARVASLPCWWSPWLCARHRRIIGSSGPDAVGEMRKRWFTGNLGRSSGLGLGDVYACLYSPKTAEGGVEACPYLVAPTSRPARVALAHYVVRPPQDQVIVPAPNPPSAPPPSSGSRKPGCAVRRCRAGGRRSTRSCSCLEGRRLSCRSRRRSSSSTPRRRSVRTAG
jgi:hypothetical protein